MRIGGLLKFSLIDYPGKVAAVVFTQGCNYRCPFCHNPELVLPESFKEPVDTGAVVTFLEKRRGQLQGVVITGGEPTLQPGLLPFMRRVKDMGFLLKLDTNGSNPQVLAAILQAGLADYLAMDIKSSPAGYARAAGVPVDMDAVAHAVALIKASGVPYMFRTTAVKGFVAADDVAAIRGFLGAVGFYKLQRGNLKAGVLDPALLDGPSDFSEDEWRLLEAACAGMPGPLTTAPRP